ncbi:unnamed protein product [Dimorphilus gyrociliatus]|uniref:Uncharacterized protein n=1 Tax=Dimorphilus gyrociliatus TaxID=2664684 RepID=A0A7I8W600_9ANNE|nr:unnamed protein product [Dimorphilus gyrociliatus]
MKSERAFDRPIPGREKAFARRATFRRDVSAEADAAGPLPVDSSVAAAVKLAILYIRSESGRHFDAIFLNVLYIAKRAYARTRSTV